MALTKFNDICRVATSRDSCRDTCRCRDRWPDPICWVTKVISRTFDLTFDSMSDHWMQGKTLETIKLPYQTNSSLILMCNYGIVWGRRPELLGGKVVILSSEGGWSKKVKKIAVIFKEFVPMPYWYKIVPVKTILNFISETSFSKLIQRFFRELKFGILGLKI